MRLNWVLGLALAWPNGGVADPPGPGVVVYERMVHLHDLLETASYGLLLQMPPQRRCRFAVLDAGGRVLASSGRLEGGQVALLRVGQWTGNRVLRLRSQGCGAVPVALRVVRLGKASPDHGNSVLMARSGLRDVQGTGP